MILTNNYKLSMQIGGAVVLAGAAGYIFYQLLHKVSSLINDMILNMYIYVIIMFIHVVRFLFYIAYIANLYKLNKKN